MPNQRFKSENYSNFGGINAKISPYQQGPQEFLDLTNFDFQTPGSLTSRWGSTQYITQAANFTGQIQSLYEFSQLSGGISTVVASVSGGIWYGATTGQFQGMSLASVRVTLGVPVNLWERYEKSGLGGGYFAAQATGGASGFIPYYHLNQTSFGVASLFIAGQPHNQNQLDYVTFQNQLFLCDGSKFLKFDGTNTYAVGLPGGLVVGGTLPFVSSVIGSNDLGDGIGNAASLGLVGPGFFYGLAASYVNSRGYQGPVWPIGILDYTTQNGASVWKATRTSIGGTDGTTNITSSYYINTPSQYGISTINLWIYQGVSIVGYQPTVSGNPAVIGGSLYAYPYRFLSSVAASGSTVTSVTYDSYGTSGNVGAFTPGTSYIVLGITNSPYTNIANFFPRYMELYSNRLFLAGFSTQPSNLWFSDVGEPEGYQDDWFIEVRTNDGDRLTALKSYNGNLLAFKLNSFHILSGDNPANFFLQEVSDEYGCLSNRAVEVYNNQLVFLDRKGVMQFNGANVSCISDKIQPTFDTMNIAAAIDNATMVHDKSRNQLMLGIPVNGSTLNNLTVVYDYLLGAWTKYDGFNPAVFSLMQGRLGNRGVFYGGYTGMFFNFGASLFGDNGIGFTCYLKTRFLHDMGESVEKQYRRLYANMSPVSSVTIPININFYQDYGSSIISGASMFQNQVQSRIDFGIPAKSLSFEMFRNSASLPIQVHGYVLESRFQRNT